MTIYLFMLFAAELLGIPTPPPYLYLTGQSIAHGVNFATGGSGVTYALGPNPLGTQVDNLELFLRTDPYSKVALANSISFVAVDGNDYTTFSGNISNTVTTSLLSIEFKFFFLQFLIHIESCLISKEFCRYVSKH